MFSTAQVARGMAAAVLVAALATSVGSLPVAFAETAPAGAPVDASGSAPASLAASAASAASATTDATTVTPVATSTVAAAAPKKLTVRETIAKTGRDAGLSKSEIDALLWVAKRESNYHPTSVSRGGCYGLFQLSRGMAKGHPWKDPAWNTKRAIKYMRGRYGSVLRAKAFWASHHWY